MKLDRLSRLLSAFNQVAPQTQENKIEQDQAAAKAASTNSEAVRLANEFGNSASTVSPEARQAKLDEIAAKVRSGTYRADSQEVAKALIRDLFV